MKKYLLSSAFALLSLLALSCSSTKNTVSASEKSETVATSADRLCSSLMIDTFSKFFTLSVDSMVIILAPREIFPPGSSVSIPADSGNAPSRLRLSERRDQACLNSSEHEQTRRMSGYALDDAHFPCDRPPANGNFHGGMKPTTEQPQALKIYGLQVGAGNDQKSELQSSSEDSEAKATQSSQKEEDIVRKTSPSNAPKYLFYIFLIALAIWIIYKLRS